MTMGLFSKTTYPPARTSRPRRHLPLMLLVFLLGTGFGALLDRHIIPPVLEPSRTEDRHGPEMRLFTEAWNAIRKNYVNQPAIQSRAFAYATIKGMVEALGDTEHSQFLTPEMRKEEQEELDGEFAGIGVHLEERNRQIVITSLFDHAPAQRHGIRPGDVVEAVSGQPVAGMSPDQVQEAVRGPAGSAVQLAIKDRKTGKAQRLTLVRERIGQVSVNWAMVPGSSVALVQIRVFSAGTADVLARALASAVQAGASGLILDLRNNPGGYEDEAIEVASQFLRKGNVALKKDGHGVVTPVPVQAGAQKCDLAMAVLINHESASAAEIVAGALQDHKRAVLVGEQSFGAGTILDEIALSDGSSLRLAIEEWLTPNGQVIWHRGLSPDVALPLPKKTILLTPQTVRDLSENELLQSQDEQLLEALDSLATD
ncbi:MAG: S41 family peptidase [Gallionellaceae bacterium]|nr:S41 family peptidase [Gallionellaceae bacterium]